LSSTTLPSAVPYSVPKWNVLTRAQVLTALEEAIARGDIPDSSVTDEVLRGFLSDYGRRFYGLPPNTRHIRLTRGGAHVEESLRGDGVEVVPFRAGEETWGVEWL
jgi:dihydroorotase